MSDFWLWQYESRKNWITYSKEENQLLNKAVLDKDVSVTLPSKNSKNNCVVDFENLIKKSMKTLYEQRIRCLVFSSDFYLWVWKNELGEWCSYKPHLAALLEIACLNGEKVVSYSDNGDFDLDLESFELTNKGSQQVTYVKREKVSVCTSLKIQSISEMNSTELASLLDKKSCKRKNTDQDKAPRPLTSVGGSGMEKSSLADPNTVIPVDAECPEKDFYHIYTKEGTIFQATLHQTVVQRNNNKFYIIQLLEHNETKQLAVWRRWGRVGVRGQTEMIKYGHSFDEALTSFEKKFYEKTKNCWADRNNFSHVPLKYDLLHTEINFSPEPKMKKAKPSTDVESKLEVKLQALLKIISDKLLMEEEMKDMSYDSSKTPLGKLTEKQLQEGYTALDKISKLLKENQNRSSIELVTASNAFYTKIPHNFGMKKPPVIRTQTELEAKLAMLEALSHISEAMEVMNDSSTRIEHPLDKYYNSLNCSLKAVNADSHDYAVFQDCLRSTHGPTHSSYKLELIDLFKCHKEEEEESHIDYDNKLLLWHGSRITNWMGILKNGLRIAPPEAPSTGYMFGKGIYFSDVSSKSANYCYATRRKNEGLLLLCEVSLGKMLHLTEADERLPASLPSGYHSVKGEGRMHPTSKMGFLPCEAKVLHGPLLEEVGYRGSLYYNEYIVYNTKQVKMKYIGRVKFDFK